MAHEIAEAGSEKEISIRIEIVRNGVVVRACKYGQPGKPNSYKEMSYVYKDVDEALAKIPTLINVLREGKDKKGY